MNLSHPDLEKAYQIRKDHFEPLVYFYAPSLKHFETSEWKNSEKPYFTAVSITGKTCALRCKHCQAKILESMPQAKDPDSLWTIAQDLKEKGCAGLLISGGSDKKGIVPILPFVPVVAKIKEELQLKTAAHLGLVPSAYAKEISKAKLDIVMLDIIGSSETSKEIYGLNVSPRDYQQSVENLIKNGCFVVPHIVIGLHYGKILGETVALKMLSELNDNSSKGKLAALVLVIIMPLKGTPLENTKPPEPEAILELFIQARLLFPKLPLLLGCARPLGEDQIIIDQLALKAGFNGIAYPAEGTISFAKNLGLQPEFSELCCSFIGLQNYTKATL